MFSISALPVRTTKRCALLLAFVACFILFSSAAELESAGVPGGPAAGSELPVIQLETARPVVSDAKVPCKVQFALPKSAEPGAVLPGVIRIHGASSQMYDKKSYAITLDAPVRWLGLPERAHWILNAAAVDHSLMRHKLSYDVFRLLAATNAPRFAAASRFIEVSFNGAYQGVYLLMERVDRSMLGFSSYSTNSPQHACIYKATDHSATFDHTGHYGFAQREPDPLTAGEYWAPLDQLNAFVSSASDRDFFNPTKGISARVDLDNALDFHLLILLTSNMDGFDKNLILARNAPTSHAPASKFFFVPWDYDATFGRNWEGSRVAPNEWLSNHLFDRLLENSAYRTRFAARWRQLRQNEFAVTNLCRMIDDNVQTVGPAVRRNAGRRGAGGGYSQSLTFDRDIAEMKAWVAQRTGFLDAEISRRTSH